MYLKNSIFLVMFFLLFQPFVVAQIKEPDFIGDAYLLKKSGERIPLDKEIAAFTQGASFQENSWNALSLEINGGQAKTRIPAGSSIQLIIRAHDNNSDPLSFISIYRFQAKKKKRFTVLSEDNSGTYMKSRTHTKNQLVFVGEKYGNASYLLLINDIEPGEYGIVVSNPNNVDQKRTVVSCFGVDTEVDCDVWQ